MSDTPQTTPAQRVVASFKEVLTGVPAGSAISIDDNIAYALQQVRLRGVLMINTFAQRGRENVVLLKEMRDRFNVMAPAPSGQHDLFADEIREEGLRRVDNAEGAMGDAQKLQAMTDIVRLAQKSSFTHRESVLFMTPRKLMPMVDCFGAVADFVEGLTPPPRETTRWLKTQSPRALQLWASNYPTVKHAREEVAKQSEVLLRKPLVLLEGGGLRSLGFRIGGAPEAR